MRKDIPGRCQWPRRVFTMRWEGSCLVASVALSSSSALRSPGAWPGKPRAPRTHRWAWRARLRLRVPSSPPDPGSRADNRTG